MSTIFFVVVIQNDDPTDFHYEEIKADYYEIFPGDTLAFFTENSKLLKHFKPNSWGALFDDYGAMLAINDYWCLLR